MNALPQARAAVRSLAASRIREVANAAMGRPGVLPFWFGEPDTVTPAAVREAGVASLNAGETFYSQNFGLPELRKALGRYSHRLHGLGSAERIVVTNSGMSALAIANQALIAPGDRVVAIGPVWPNLTEGPRILGAEVTVVPLRFTEAGWTLDLQRLLDALTPEVRVFIVNAPGNPTGWTMSRAEQQVVLDRCRRHGTWIVADDAYERLYFGDGPDGTEVAPCFLDVAEADDRLVTANTFSKTWQMTGWRLGWIHAPQPLVEDLGKLIEFNTSCAPVFVQRAGLVAVEQGEPAVAEFVARLRRGRDVLIRGLQALPGVRVAAPEAAMYAFFAVDGVNDSLVFCKHLAAEQGLGLAPGVAFGAGGEGFLRWCFAASEARLAEGLERLARGLATR
jgi:aspartate/methionine/tyrosine aminotransferase